MDFPRTDHHSAAGRHASTGGPAKQSAQLKAIAEAIAENLDRITVLTAQLQHAQACTTRLAEAAKRLASG